MGDVFVTMLAYRKFFPNCAWKAYLLETHLFVTRPYLADVLVAHREALIRPRVSSAQRLRGFSRKKFVYHEIKVAADPSFGLL
jgi:hypothetical protein